MEIGIDIVAVHDLRIRLKRTPSLKEKLFSLSELLYCKGNMQRLAARFAAKEATKKAIRVPVAVEWKDIVLGHKKNGQPTITLPKKIIEKCHIRDINISLSHNKDMAVACVIITYN